MQKEIHSLQSDTSPKAAINAEPLSTKTACHIPTVEEVATLLERWNEALQSGDADQVVALYAESSILLPTLSYTPRETPGAKRSYFEKFVLLKPFTTVNQRWISVGCNMAVDAGIYTFDLRALGEEIKARYTFTYLWNGNDWLINSHHSSVLPEDD